MTPVAFIPCVWVCFFAKFDAVSPVVTVLRLVVILAFAVVGAVLGFLVYDATSSSDINTVRHSWKELPLSRRLSQIKKTSREAERNLLYRQLSDSQPVASAVQHAVRGSDTSAPGARDFASEEERARSEDTILRICVFITRPWWPGRICRI